MRGLRPLLHIHISSFSHPIGQYPLTGRNPSGQATLPTHPSDFLKSEPFLMFLGDNLIRDGATVRGSVVRDPIIMGEGSVIDQAYIGPYTAIGANVTVTNSEIENTVVMENSVIRDVSPRIDSSLIGNHVSITPPANKPRCIGFVLGDQSSVEVI